MPSLASLALLAAVAAPTDSTAPGKKAPVATETLDVSVGALDSAVRWVISGSVPEDSRSRETRAGAVATGAPTVVFAPEVIVLPEPGAVDSAPATLTVGDPTAGGVPTVGAVISVEEDVVDPRINPDYHAEEPVGFADLPDWAKYLRFPDYGQANSPSFDQVTQQFWWE